jgi:hypothetical protein
MLIHFFGDVGVLSNFGSLTISCIPIEGALLFFFDYSKPASRYSRFQHSRTPTSLISSFRTPRLGP